MDGHGNLIFLLHQLLSGLLEAYFLENFLRLVYPYKVSPIFWHTLIPIIRITHPFPMTHEVHPNEHSSLFKFLKLI